MSPPLSAASSQEDSAPAVTAARSSPLPGWASGVLLSPIAASYYLGLDAEGFAQLLRETSAPVLVAGALVFLLAAIALGRWGNRLMLSRKRPDEPWLWDQTWRDELSDHQLGQVVGGWLISIPFLAILAFFHRQAYIEGFSEGHVFLSALLSVVLLIFDAAIFVKLIRPAALKTLALLRFGRMRLRLPGVPLALGCRCQVHLVGRPSLAQLPDVKVELRRIREWKVTTGSGKNRSTRTITDTEYTHEHTVDAAALREGRDLAISLDLPRAGPEHSTVLHSSRRCYWELQLSSEVPGVDLDTTFVLPVYYTVGENPASVS